MGKQTFTPVSEMAAPLLHGFVGLAKLEERVSLQELGLGHAQ